MSRRTIFRPEARSGLRKVPRSAAVTVFRRLTELERDPLGFGTTALVGSPEVRRLLVGDHRVIHILEDDRPAIRVVHVGHRSTVYDRSPLVRTLRIASSVPGREKPVASFRRPDYSP